MPITDLYFGDQPAWKDVMTRVETVAPTPWPLLLVGPRGSGKTLLAAYIHRRSGLSGQFVPGQAPSIPESLLQGELLGHARGAFTDARSDSGGMLELAHQGTLFLDEIEAASHALQSLLVGQVERHDVRRVRDARSRQVEVRYIYATNSDLRELVRRGQFRADLLDRISGVEIRMPALVEYRGALLSLSQQFIREDADVLGKQASGEFSFDVISLFLTYDWPGNLRELRNVCREIAIRFVHGRPVLLEDLPGYLLTAPARDPTIVEFQILMQQVGCALREAGGNKSEAARRLHMHRSAFDRLLAKVGRQLEEPGHICAVSPRLRGKPRAIEHRDGSASGVSAAPTTPGADSALA